MSGLHGLARAMHADGPVHQAGLSSASIRGTGAMLGLVITGCMFVALFGWTLPALAQPGVEAARGQTAGAATRVAGDAVAVEVYKKWIGAAGDEADVEIHLVCGDDASFPPLSVNQGKSAVWSIGAVTAAGTFCTVLEVERDSFIGDDSDCRDLLLLPGQGAECTLVNTKLVKRIDMLNRYGLVMMIAVMMGAGLAAVRRYH